MVVITRAEISRFRLIRLHRIGTAHARTIAEPNIMNISPLSRGALAVQSILVVILSIVFGRMEASGQAPASNGVFDVGAAWYPNGESTFSTMEVTPISSEARVACTEM